MKISALLKNTAGLIALVCLVGYAYASAPSGVTYVKWDSPGPVFDGKSWSTAFHSIQAGINAAAGGEVWVAKGIYNEKVSLKPNTAIYGGFVGNETQRIARNWSANPTVIDAQASGAAIICASGCVVDGFTIRNGTGVSLSGIAAGGGVYAHGCSNVEISNCIITQNSASDHFGHGGGIYASGSQLRINGSSITGNNAGAKGFGGGIYAIESSIEIIDSQITNNVAAGDGRGGGRGAGIFITTSSLVTLAGCTVSNNQSSAEYARGAGLYCENSALNAERTAFLGNAVSGANSAGGGIDLYLAESKFVNCIISGNSANSGAGMRFVECAPNIMNCTVANNSAESFGGGIFVKNAASGSIVNTILYGNSAVEGGAAYVDGGTLPSVAYCNIFSNGANPFAPASWNPVGSNGNISANPMFATGGFKLLYGSPCINAGTNAGAPSNDFEGEPRPVDGIGFGQLVTDMGAYEFQLSPAVILQSTAQVKNQTAGSRVAVLGKVVTATGNGFFYLEEPDRSSGIRVASNAQVQVGQTASISGLVGYAGLEMQINATAVNIGGFTTVPEPFSLSIKNLGGGKFGNQYGVHGGVGLNNIGLLVRVFGKVTATGPNYLILNDGSGYEAKIFTPYGNVAGKGWYISATGVSTFDGSNRAVYTRTASDIQADHKILYVDDSAPAGGNGTSWALAFNRIQDAVLAASEGDEIWIAGGRYVERVQLLPKLSLYGGFGGFESSREERNPSIYETVIDGEGRLSGMVSAEGCVIDGISIANTNGFYGAIQCVNASSTIRNCRFIDNVARYGAGVACSGPGAQVTIDGCYFFGNSAQAGGAIISFNGATATISANKIYNNSATVGGGAIYLQESTNAVVNNWIIGNNSDRDGAGIFILYVSESNIINNTLAYNRAEGSGGGFLICIATPVVMNNIVYGCSAQYGGGVYGFPPTGIWDYNAVWGNLVPEYWGVYVGAHDFNMSPWFVAPQFINPWLGDYHLLPISRCIDAGNASAPGLPLTDAEGRPRIIGTAPDMGAAEFVPAQ